MNKSKISGKEKKLNGSRGLVKSTLVTYILILLFFITVIFLFFGDGFLKEGFEKIKEIINHAPEVDPSTSNDFFRINDMQLKFFSGWYSSIENALAGPSQGGCIMTLPSLDQDGFYNENSNYNLYMDQDGQNINIRLTRYVKQNFETNDQKTEAPVATRTIENAKLCIIKDADAVSFYEEFNEISAGDVPDITRINPTNVNSLLITSGKSDKTKREIGYLTNLVTPSTTPADYTWEDFFKRGDKTIIYAVRIDRGGAKYVCFFPAKKDLGSGCGKPINGLMQLSCFDSDAGKNSLKYNLDPRNNLISSYFVCSTMPAAQAQSGASSPSQPSSTTKTTP